jgi:hypothetical protein
MKPVDMKPLFIGVSTIVFSALHASAAINLITTGVYDEAVNTNAVDATAPGSSGTLATFKTNVATAYANNTGGVITFDNIVMPPSSGGTFTQDSSLSVTYGLSASNILTITHNSTGGDFQFQENTAVGTAISGASYLRNAGPGAGVGSHNYIFSTALTELGFTILSRSGARTVTATVTYENGQTASLTDTMANGVGVDDTFYYFTAGASPIKSLFLVSSTNTEFFSIDDIGFITVPEPSSMLLGAVGMLALFRRRRA